MKTQILERPRSLPVRDTQSNDSPPCLLRNELEQRLKAKLVEYGWKLMPGDPAAELACFKHLLPPPDTTLTVANPATGEHGVVAIHFAESKDAIWYACTLRLANGRTVQEHGLIDVASGAMRLVELRGDMHAQRPSD